MQRSDVFPQQASDEIWADNKVSIIKFAQKSDDDAERKIDTKRVKFNLSSRVEIKQKYLFFKFFDQFLMNVR